MATLAGAVALCLAAAPIAAQPARHVQAFAGAMTDNEWGEILRDPGGIVLRDAGTVGAGIGREWPLGRAAILGVEANLLGWAGEQTHLELAAPLYLRTPRSAAPWLPSLAYGLGLSLASRPPASEIARTGESTELLAHWFLEAEFGGPDSRWRPYLRLHHRSHAWRTFGVRTGSNALLLGLRWTR